MNLSVGHTPDSDDALMFYGMLTGKVSSPGFVVKQFIGDIEDLNRRALNAELDVTAASVHACAYIPEYTILRSGGSFGLEYGPIVVAREEIPAEKLKNSRIAVPGKMTSAFLLLQLMIGRFEYVEMEFSSIPQAVRDGRVDAGLVIHEGQITYKKEGNVKISDLGEWWSEYSGGLPVPLGINVMRSRLGLETISKFDLYLQDSIEYGLNNLDKAVDYAMRYGRGNERSLIERFVKMYVNKETITMSEAGETAIRRFFEMAKMKNLVPDFEVRIAPPA